MSVETINTNRKVEIDVMMKLCQRTLDNKKNAERLEDLGDGTYL